MHTPEYERRTDPEIADILSGRNRMQKRPKSKLQTVLAGTIAAVGVAAAFFPDQTRQVLDGVGMINNGNNANVQAPRPAENSQTIIDPRK